MRACVRACARALCRYNDVSVLENMHAATLMQLIEGTRRNAAFPSAPVALFKRQRRRSSGHQHLHHHHQHHHHLTLHQHRDDATRNDSNSSYSPLPGARRRGGAGGIGGGSCNVFAGLDADHWQALRRVMVEAILGTDMAKHFSHLAALQAFFAAHDKGISAVQRRRSSVASSIAFASATANTAAASASPSVASAAAASAQRGGAGGDGGGVDAATAEAQVS